jgi:hypothetical protein
MRMRVIAALVLAAACVGAATAQTARAAVGVKFGIQDDAWLEGGPGRIGDRAATLQRMGFDVVRVTIDWSETETSLGDFDWRRADRLLGALHRHSLQPVVTLWGTPEWASSSGSRNAPPASGAAFKRFAQAIATRYPYVRYWLIWNEPNKAQWLHPVSPSLYVTRLLNPGYAGIKSANPSAKVGGGVTAPRGGKGGMTPVDFIHGMARAGAHLDAYAHNPYPVYPGDTPYAGGCSCKVITMATLERLLSNVGRFFPRARVWLTEYAYQTKPDPYGISFALQARYIGEAARRVYTAPKVDMLIHYLFRDEPDLARWQSGLETVNGTPKPALDATMLPLAQVSRRGTRTVVWGQVRPGTGPQEYALQRWTGSSWVTIGGLRVTSARGYLVRALAAGRGTFVRLWYPARGLASPTLVVR